MNLTNFYSGILKHVGCEPGYIDVCNLKYDFDAQKHYYFHMTRLYMTRSFIYIPIYHFCTSTKVIFL